MAAKKSSTQVLLSELDSSLRNRLRRVRSRWLFILHSALAAGFSFWTAREIFGHENPFFAPMSVVIILGLSGGDRVRRAIDLTLGCAIGVGIGDLVILQIGSGYWQMFVVIALGLTVASFLSKSMLVANQVAIGSILIATIMPPGNSAGFDRMIDAFIGGAIGILVIAILPSSPLQSGRTEMANILAIASSVLDDVARALKAKDEQALSIALNAVRSTQGDVDRMVSAASSGKEISTISPFLWNNKGRVRTLLRITPVVDNMIRDTRVLARRALILTEDQDEVSPEQIEVISELSKISGEIAFLYQHHKEKREAIEIPELVNRLRILGSKVGPEIAEGRVLSAQVILAQTRSIIVDLLQICGMSRESADAVLVPTSETPRHPPEVWK